MRYCAPAFARLRVRVSVMRSQLNRFVATHNLCKFNSPSECGIPGDAVTGMLSKLSAQSMCASVQ